jgi:predicted enzyme related to lactoylglutathione lyase
MGDPHRASLRSVVIDCPDPSALARFYAELLGGRAVTTDPDWCEVLFDGPPKLAFQLATNYQPPEWPDGAPQQLHLDLTVSDIEAVSSRAVALGARVLARPVRENGSVFMVHADPAGHPFCLCQDLG